MNKKFFYGMSIMALMFTAASCGGGEEETTSEETTEEVTAVEYTIDTEASVINWWNKEGEEKGHTGTVKVLDGTYTLEGDVITAASMNVDMTSITADSDKLLGHLTMTDHFFSVMTPDTISADSINWVDNNTTAVFTFEKHEEGMIYGSVNVNDLDFAVEAPVTVTEGQIELGEFSVDMSGLTYFVMEVANVDVPEEERHDPNIGFTATIVAQK